MEDQLDPEMLENLDMLLVLDVLEEEESWDTIEKLEDDEANKDPEVES